VLQALNRSPRGVAVLLNCSADTATLKAQCLASDGDRAPAVQAPMDLRTYGIGAQILRDLGVARMRLLGSPRRMPSMTGYGLDVTGFVTHSD
jgi:3,4-dihydroxy 2-butanone 4-phosphate synthase / GTP cyclohydrolase II